jgi:hypothetical protein
MYDMRGRCSVVQRSIARRKCVQYVCTCHDRDPSLCPVSYYPQMYIFSESYTSSQYPIPTNPVNEKATGPQPPSSNHSCVPSPLFLPPPPILPRLPPPNSPPLPGFLMPSLHLLRPVFRLHHHAHKKLTTPKLLRQFHSRPRIRILRPQAPNLTDFRVREMVLFLIWGAHGCWQVI